MFRFSLVFYTCVFVVLLVAGVVLWLAASAVGVVDNVETFLGELLAVNDFRFRAGQILRSSALGGAILVLLGTGANVLAAVLYNLISDVIGGVELVVLEEETPRSVV